MTKIFIAQIEVSEDGSAEFPHTGETIEIGIFSTLDKAKAAVEHTFLSPLKTDHIHIIRVDQLDPDFEASRYRKTELFFLTGDRNGNLLWIKD